MSKFDMTALSLRGDVFPILSHSPTPGCARMRMLFSLRGLTWGHFNEYGTWASVVSKCGLTALSAGRASANVHTSFNRVMHACHLQPT